MMLDNERLPSLAAPGWWGRPMNSVRKYTIEKNGGAE